MSVCLSALRLAISGQRVVRSTSFLACARGPPGPRMCAVRSTVGVRHERRKSAESIIRVRKHARSTPDEARQRRVYNAIRVDSVPSCSWTPRGRAHEYFVLCHPSTDPKIHDLNDPEWPFCVKFSPSRTGFQQLVYILMVEPIYVIFYPRNAMLARVFATATCLSVCLSVCPSRSPSVTCRYCA